MDKVSIPSPEKSPIECIREQLESCFHPTELEITDDFAKHIGHAHMGAGHYSVRIVAPEFSSLLLIQRHRMIYAALEKLLQSDIHALSIKALAPGESR
ncbi:MAG: BolA family transcriptional regulator [Gammaproteobacteria bacterium]|nr:BolA family transcriptional regulator [Gammaproteobacteria bacterium]MDE2346736.1 BolA family transcriptional regulator [Gammaproteobacteria bacterium]